MVRPRIAPLSRPCNFEYVSAGSDQLFVGPASAFVGVQIKVNCSTRATSFEFERCKYERGAFFWFSLINTSCFSDSEKGSRSRARIRRTKKCSRAGSAARLHAPNQARPDLLVCDRRFRLAVKWRAQGFS